VQFCDEPGSNWQARWCRPGVCRNDRDDHDDRAGAVQQAPVFRAGVDLVNFAVTVTDRKGNLVTDLGQDDFELFEDGKVQALTYFASSDGDPGEAQPEMHLGLLLDVSGSMGEDLSFVKTAAVKFFNRLTDAVDVTVMDFDTEVRSARYSQAEFARLIERIRQKKVSGYTAIYDAVGVYLDGAAAQSGRKIMLLYTDGGDTRSSLAFHELQDLLKASDATIYVIGMLEHQLESTKSTQRLMMLQMAEATGGQAYFPTSPKQLDEMYDKVLAQIRAQYILGYVSGNPKTDGTWRKVEIRLRKDDRGLRARTRKGYFAPLKR
jgi:Ca-activated chloride channel family protein